MKILFFLTFVLLFSHTAAFSQCLKLIPFDNPDSVYWDTCALTTKYYATHWWEIKFEENAIRLPWERRDTILEVGWDAIDSSFDSIRAGFRDLEQYLGVFWLRKYEPSDTSSVSGSISHWFRLRFDSIVPADSVAHYLHLIPGIHWSWSFKPLLGRVNEDFLPLTRLTLFVTDIIKLSAVFDGNSNLLIYDILGKHHFMPSIGQGTYEVKNLQRGIYYYRTKRALITIIKE